jgi:HSP20 family molecular chaperone IbpA
LSKEEKKVKKQSRLLLRFAVFVLLIISLLEAYIIFKSRKFIEEYSGEKGLVKFVGSEFEKDKKSVEHMFERFLKDTSSKGTAVKDSIKEDISTEVTPVKEKFDKWYSNKFGDSRITHTTRRTGNGIVITVNVPDVKKESIDITVQDNIIKMSGNLKGEGSKHFYHTILVPKQADSNNSEVDFDAGGDKIDIIFKLK